VSCEFKSHRSPQTIQRVTAVRYFLVAQLVAQNFNCECCFLASRETIPQKRMRLSRPTFKCPSCGAIMRNDTYKARKPWTCAACFRQFQFSRLYGNLVAWGSMGLTLTILALLGLRGLRLFVATVVMWFPLLLLCVIVFDRLLPPRLVPFQPEE
jgi:hypothetical protein